MKKLETFDEEQKSAWKKFVVLSVIVVWVICVESAHAESQGVRYDENGIRLDEIFLTPRPGKTKLYAYLSNGPSEDLFLSGDETYEASLETLRYDFTDVIVAVKNRKRNQAFEYLVAFQESLDIKSPARSYFSVGILASGYEKDNVKFPAAVYDLFREGLSSAMSGALLRFVEEKSGEELELLGPMIEQYTHTIEDANIGLEDTMGALNLRYRLLTKIPGRLDEAKKARERLLHLSRRSTVDPDEVNLDEWLLEMIQNEEPVLVLHAIELSAKLWEDEIHDDIVDNIKELAHMETPVGLKSRFFLVAYYRWRQTGKKPWELLATEPRGFRHALLRVHRGKSE